MCLFFYRHSCCIKWPRGLNFCPLPGKFSGTVELSLHSWVSQSTTRCVWGGGERGAPILYTCLASVLSFIHLELKKYVLGITQTHPYGIDLYTTEWFFFLPNININEDLGRKHDTENNIPRIKVSPECGQGFSPNGCSV